jgi:hypothetical protein
MASSRAVRDRWWGRVLRRQLLRGRASPTVLHPTLAGDPPNWLAGTTVDEYPGIFVGQPARPFLKSLVGKFSAFGVGILEGSTKLRAAATIKLVANGLCNELASVLLPSVNVPDEIIGQGNGHTFDACHFILSL